jgi:HK97 family phage prohead protease
MPDTLMPAAGPGQRHALALELRADMHASGLGGYAQLRDVQVRDASQTPDGSWIFEGHAAVFNTTTTLFEFTDSLGTVTVTEDIAPGAFATALGQPDLLCHLNNGHDMTLVMASTDVNGIGGLRVTQDAHGLPYTAKVDPAVSYINDAGILLRSGVIRGASFKFTVAPHGEKVTITGDPEGDVTYHYTIEDIDHLYDVCVCAQGAYRQATSGIRSRVLHGHTSPTGGVDGGRARRPEATDVAGRGVSTVPEGGRSSQSDADYAAHARSLVDLAHSTQKRSV